MIFLGAGASKPYGIPTLEEFSKDAIDELQKLGHGSLVREIQESFLEFNLKLDFESLYSILEKLYDPFKSVQLLGPFTAFLIKNKENLKSLIWGIIAPNSFYGRKWIPRWNSVETSRLQAYKQTKLNPKQLRPWVEQSILNSLKNLILNFI